MENEAPARARPTDASTKKENRGKAVRRREINVHHIDGKPANNERANLQLVCGRCHDGYPREALREWYTKLGEYTHVTSIEEESRRAAMSKATDEAF